MSRRLLGVLIVLLTLFLLVSSTFAQTVLSRTRVGNFPEGSAYVSTGTLTGNIVVLDGVDVFAFPLVKPRKGPGVTKVFNLKALSVIGHPNAVAYIPQDKLFVFTEGISPDTLFLSDSSGNPKGTITIKYPAGSVVPNHVEGIAYIPPNSPIYPDHFVTAAVEFADFYHQRLEVIARDGTVTKEIHPATPYFDPNDPNPLDWVSMIGGVDFLPGGTLLCGVDNNLVEYTFEGNLVRMVTLDTGWFEGITRLPNGTFVGVGYQRGMVTFFDASLQRTPSLDRSYQFAPELTEGPSGIAWDSDTGEYLMRFNSDPVTANYDPGIWEMPRSLGTTDKLFSFPLDPNPNPGSPIPIIGQYRQMAYMPDEHLLAMLYRQDGREGMPPHADIHLFDRWGSLVQIIHVTAFTYPSRGVIQGSLAYIPSLRQFVIHQANPDGTPNPYANFISRDTGTLVRTIDLTAAGMATGFGVVTYFNDGVDDKLLFLSNRTRMVVTGLGGTKLQEFDTRATMAMLFPGNVSIGPTPGTFATMDNGEFIVFQITPPTTKKKK